MSYITDILSMFTTIYKLLLEFPIIGISFVAGALVYRWLLLKNPTLLQSLVTKAETAIADLEGKSSTTTTTTTTKE